MTGAPLAVADLRTEHLAAPLAVDDPHPRFSWIVTGDGIGRRQSAFQIVVTGDDGTFWDTGRIESAETLGHAYDGAPLAPLTRYIWTVTVWDEADHLSEPATSTFATGLLGGAWRAPWICVPPSKGARPPEATLALRNPFRALNVSQFRKTFALSDGVKWARLYATALGACRFFINGKRVGDDYLTPGFTDYHKRVEYNAYDVAGHLQGGDNVIAALLGEGWYAGFVGLDSKRPGGLWGRKPQLSAFLLVALESGETIGVETDPSWRHAIGGLIYSDMLKGEKFDSRLHPAGWDSVGFDDANWEEAGTDRGAARLVAANKAPPIRNTWQLAAKSVAKAPDGAWIFDLGQNMVGFVEARFRARPDQVVRLVHAEMLDADGNLYIENLRTAVQEDIYVASRDGPVSYAPTFVFHGFRYVGVYGLDYEPEAGDVTGIVIHNDLPETATFETSSDLLNQLHSNILWSQRGNFVSVPMDCPQRDERLGWTADGQVFAPSAAYNMDISAFFTKWLDDIADDQSEEGAFPDVAPRVSQTNDGAPAWGDAGVILPLLLYERYADTRVVQRMYEPMKRWLAFIEKHNPDGIRVNRNHNNYGDWLAIGQQTPNDLAATAYYAWLAKLMGRAATLLGNDADARTYEALHRHVRGAFQAKYVGPDGRIGSQSQTSYLLALFAELVPDDLIGQAVSHLVDNIHAAGNKVQVGFLGVRHVCPILTEHGHADLAYRLATSTEFPSWGYSIVNGATTIWERWDGWTKEHGFQIPNMNSFNHYAYGSIGEWLFGWMAGIAPDPEGPGYSRFVLRPTPGPGVEFCKATFDSPRGRIVSNWKRETWGGVTYTFTVPANTEATVELVAAEGAKMSVNDELTNPEYLPRYGGTRAVLILGSGDYQIVVG